jgi:hypothetical protein
MGVEMPPWGWRSQPPPGPHDGTTTPVKRRWGTDAVDEGEMGRGHCRGGGAPSAWDGHAAAGCRGGALLPRPPPEGHGEGESHSDPPAEGKGRGGRRSC